MVQAPFSISSAVQRVDRAGHRVNEVGRATIFPSHAADCVSTAVPAQRIMAGDTEEVKPVLYPLDVLAQIIAAMTATETWNIDDFCRRQRTATGGPLPHRHHVVVEYSRAGPGGFPGNQVILHTFWGGRVNRPFALAPGAAWEERFGQGLEIFPGNDCIVLVLPVFASSA